VRLADGRQLAWDHLVLATGAIYAPPIRSFTTDDGCVYTSRTVNAAFQAAAAAPPVGERLGVIAGLLTCRKARNDVHCRTEVVIKVCSWPGCLESMVVTCIRHLGALQKQR
jgi:hypothetical protein